MATLSTLTPVDYAFSFQGLFLLGNGFYTLFWPGLATELPSPLAGASIGVVHALSMTSLSLGFYYLQAVYQRNRAVMVAAVPLRLLATVVTSRNGGSWRMVGMYEAAMGTLTTGCLLWERRSLKSKST